MKMMGKILVATVFAGLCFGSPAMADDTSATTTTSTSSDTAGLANAYGTTFTGVGSSGACCGNYDYKNSNGNANAVISNFNQKLSAMQLAIIEAMRLSTGQNTAGQAQQTGAAYNLADQQDDRSTVKSVEEARLRAIMEAESSPSACAVITTSRGGSSQGAANQVAAAFSQELSSWTRGESDISKKGKDFSLATRVAAHCKYATSSDVDSGLCQSLGSSTLSDDEASKSLLKVDAGGMKYTYAQDTLEAARMFVLNTASPIPVQQLSTAEAKTPEGLIKKAQQSTYMGRASVSVSMLNDFFAARAPIITDDKTIGNMNALAKEMQGYGGVSFDNGASKTDWLAMQSRMFVGSPSRLAAADKNMSAAVKEIKNILAVIAYQNFENYLQMEKMNVNLALNNSILNDSNRASFEGR
jgi:hypothetical protein